MKNIFKLFLTLIITIGCLYLFVRANTPIQPHVIKSLNHSHADTCPLTGTKKKRKTSFNENPGVTIIPAKQLLNNRTEECKETIPAPVLVASAPYTANNF